MKKFFLFVSLFSSFGLLAQYKHQLKVSLLGVNGSYSYGINIAFESLNKKFNYLIDYQGFGDFYTSKSKITKENQQYYYTETDISTRYIGINLGTFTSLSKSDKFSLNGGIKMFLGRHTNATQIKEYILDSSRFGIGWQFKDRRLTLGSIPTIYTHSFAFGAIPFIRMDAKLSSRFFLIPEIQLPLTGNTNPDKANLFFNIGFNISLAYRFSKSGV